MISQVRQNYTWHTTLNHKVNFIIQTKNSISSGNSGGPLVDENINLVGINTFSNTKGQNLNYAVSIYDIKEFIKTNFKDLQYTLRLTQGSYPFITNSDTKVVRILQQTIKNICM